MRESQLTITSSTCTALPFRASMLRCSSFHTAPGSTPAGGPRRRPGSFSATRVHDRRPQLPQVVQYPSATQDVQDAMQWVIDDLPVPNADTYTRRVSPLSQSCTPRLAPSYSRCEPPLLAVYNRVVVRPIGVPLDSASVPTRMISARELCHQLLKRQGRAIWRFLLELGTEDVIKWV